jgi:hypothetical protein
MRETWEPSVRDTRRPAHTFGLSLKDGCRTLLSRCTLLRSRFLFSCISVPIVKLESALLKLRSTERDRFKERISRLSGAGALGLQAACNLACESRLSSAAWKIIVNQVLGAGDDPCETQSALRDTMRQFILRGPSVALRKKICGRAISTDRFCRMLWQLGYYSDLGTARVAVRSMLPRSPLQIAHWWRNFDLGRYLMWGTFDATSRSVTLFTSVTDPDQVRALLGLDVNERGLPLLLIEYRLPPGTVAKIPTIADAYSADDWPYFFRPAPPKSPHGLTLPWPTHEREKPSPEIVHGVVKGRQIVSPLRELL